MRFNYQILKKALAFIMLFGVFDASAQQCVTFTGLATGSYAVTGGYPQGTPFFTESGMPVSLAAYHFPNGDVKNNVAALAGEFFWSGLFIAANTTYIKLLTSGLLFDFTQPQPGKIAGTVTFDFLDWSGYVNLTINDQPTLVETTFSEMPSEVVPGVTMQVVDQNVGAGGKMGRVTLTGDISSLVIGAEDFGIDNICYFLKDIPCEFSNLNVTTNSCNTDGTFSVDIDFQHANSSGTFSVAGNGTNYGNFNTADLPITLTGLSGDGSTNYEFVVTDSEDSQCTLSQAIGTVFCPLPCSISNLTVSPRACNGMGNFLVEINFDHANTSGTFKVTGNGTTYGTYNTSSLPISIVGLEGDGITDYEFVVSDAQIADCSASANLGVITCTPACSYSNMNVTASQCDVDGFFSAQIDFTANNSSGSFVLSINGSTNGTYNVSDLPITVDGLVGDGATEYVFQIQDSELASCTAQQSIGVVTCVPCQIWNVTVGSSTCDNNGEFFAIINFQHQSSSGTVNISNSQNDFGDFSVDQLPIVIGPLAGDGTTFYDFVIEDVAANDCSSVATLGTVACTVDCAISDLTVYDMECTSASTFRAKIDFTHQATGNSGFRLFYKGVQVGIFDYEQLPLNLNNLTTSGNVMESITVCDTNNPNCCTSINFQTTDCTTAGCEITGVLLNKNVCENGHFMVDLDLNVQSGGQLGFQILGNGNNYGTFSYTDLPISLGPFSGDGTTQYEFLVVDMLDQTCSNFAQLAVYDCIEECNISGVNANVGSCNGQGETFVLLSFDADNTSSNYTVSANGVDYGTYAYSMGDIAVGPLAGDGSSYQLVITDSQSGNCSQIIEVGPIECQTTSTHELTDEELKIFTDQHTDNLYVNLNTGANQTSVAIYNIAGQLQTQEQWRSGQRQAQYSLTALPAGIYICQVIVDE
ncbi:MAG: T9SS type A sorting domain-containing protein, partial [Bacteroidota bacterium]